MDISTSHLLSHILVWLVVWLWYGMGVGVERVCVFRFVGRDGSPVRAGPGHFRRSTGQISVGSESFFLFSQFHQGYRCQ